MWAAVGMVVLGVMAITGAKAMDVSRAEVIAKAAVADQGYPPALADRTTADTATVLVSFPAWAPLYPGAVVSAGGNAWESDAAARTARGSLSFATPDSRGTVADFYAGAFSATGEVTQYRTEEPWTIEVMSSDQTEVMTLNLEQGGAHKTNATLNYTKAPVRQ